MQLKCSECGSILDNISRITKYRTGANKDKEVTEIIYKCKLCGKLKYVIKERKLNDEKNKS